MNASASSRRSPRPLTIVVGVVIALLVILLAGELATRFIVGRQLAGTYQDRLEEQGITSEEGPKVSFGGSPLLLALVTQKVGYASLTTPDTLRYSDGGADVSGEPPSKIKLHDLDISDRDNPVAGTLTARAELTDEFLLATAQSALADNQAGFFQSLVSVTDVTSHASDGTVSVAFNDGLATVVLHPVATDDGLQFDVVRTDVAGFNLPDQVSALLSSAVTDGANAELSKLGSLRVTETTVEDGRVYATVAGENVNLNELGQAAQRFY